MTGTKLLTAEQEAGTAWLPLVLPMKALAVWVLMAPVAIVALVAVAQLVVPVGQIERVEPTPGTVRIVVASALPVVVGAAVAVGMGIADLAEARFSLIARQRLAPCPQFVDSRPCQNTHSTKLQPLVHAAEHG